MSEAALPLPIRASTKRDEAANQQKLKMNDDH
jgi:hypothetical protein